MNGRWKTSVLALALVASLGLALGGCSKSPVSPEGLSLGGGTVEAGSPPMLSVSPSGDGEYVPCETNEVGERWPEVDHTGSRYASETMKIDGAVGGRMTVGRFTLKLLPDAFEGHADVTMSMRDTTVLICELEINPSSANEFKVEAQLTADIAGLNVPDNEVMIYWYNESGDKWESVTAQSKDGGTNVTAYLKHFSAYGAGKAGW